jgi:hypothetical protein
MTAAVKSPIPPTSKPAVERSTDFPTYYSNNIVYESTAWDIKLTFGHIEQATAPVLTRNDCSVTIPWPLAKLLLFWIRLHVESAEVEIAGKIPIRKDLLPPELPDRLPEELEADPANAKRFREIYERLRADFLKTV